MALHFYALLQFAIRAHRWFLKIVIIDDNYYYNYYRCY